MNCPGSVALSEGMPDKSSVWAEEGTLAHEVLEYLLLKDIGHPSAMDELVRTPKMNNEMFIHGKAAADFILKLWRSHKDASIRVETRIHLPFIHPEMFGTFDAAVIDYFGTLHVFDYKYGAGHSVSPTNNLQMIFYGLGVAFKYHWNFKRVRLWIIQPRIKGYDGPAYWELGILGLKERVYDFKKAVAKVEASPDTFAEGPWCWWCKAKSVCPLKIETKQNQAIDIFKAKPVDKKSKLDDFY